MKVVLFATRAVGELAPISEFSCLALLTAACKPLIVHTVEALAMAGLTDVILIVSRDASAVAAALGDGARWGLRLEYVFAGSGESDESTVQRIRPRLGDEYLLVRSEMLRTPIIAEFVERARALAAQSVTATIQGVEAGLTLIRCSSGGQTANQHKRGPVCGSTGECSVEFPGARLSLLDSLAAFHRAHLDILAGDFGGLIIPGRELAPKVKVGRRTKLPPYAIKDVPLLIGSRCRIAGNAELSGNVAVSDDVVIDRRAVLRSAVVMPHTYVGELVEINNAIAAGNRLVHVDTGVVATVADSFLLAAIRPHNIAEHMRNRANRYNIPEEYSIIKVDKAKNVRSLTKDLKRMLHAVVAFVNGPARRSEGANEMRMSARRSEQAGTSLRRRLAD